MTDLVVDKITVTRDGEALVNGASLTVTAGELVVILGPNGAGKTSLLRAVLGLQKPSAGHALLGGDDVQALSPLQRARRAAYLPQIRPLAWPSRVCDVVALGRFAYGGSVGRLSAADSAAVDSALEACELTEFAMRRADTLSGGERARMHCARAFAARAPLLIADEPVAALDPRHSFKIMDMIRAYVDGDHETAGNGALVVLHDVNLAAQYADRLIWMKGGQIIVDGPPAQTLTVERLAQIYGIDAVVDGMTVTMKGAL